MKARSIYKVFSRHHRPSINIRPARSPASQHRRLNIAPESSSQSIATEDIDTCLGHRTRGDHGSESYDDGSTDAQVEFYRLLELKSKRLEFLGKLPKVNQVLTWLEIDERRAAQEKIMESCAAQPDLYRSRQFNEPETVPPEALAGPIPLSIFRQRLLNTSRNEGHRARQLFTAQLLRCTKPKEFLQIVAISMVHQKFPDVLTNMVSMTKRSVVQVLMIQYGSICRMFYRCRHNATDPAVLRCIMQFIGRCEIAKLPVDPAFHLTAIKFAARSRDLDAMRRCLVRYRRRGLVMARTQFRAIIAKCSIGHHGHGLIRNGPWDPAHLRQVLLGFPSEAHLPLEQQSHLGVHYHRNDWQYIHGWAAVLAVAKAGDEIWHEWQMWLKHPLRTDFRVRDEDYAYDKGIRGDRWFVEVMIFAGDTPRAWLVLEQSSLTTDLLKSTVLLGLVRGAHLAGPLAADLRSTLLARFGSTILSTGERLDESDLLQGMDERGQVTFSERTARLLHAHLRTIISASYLQLRHDKDAEHLELDAHTMSDHND